MAARALHVEQPEVRTSVTVMLSCDRPGCLTAWGATAPYLELAVRRARVLARAAGAVTIIVDGEFVDFCKQHREVT